MGFELHLLKNNLFEREPTDCFLFYSLENIRHLVMKAF